MKRNFCGSTPTSECTKVSNKHQKKIYQNTGQSESGYVTSRDIETRSDACSFEQPAVPLTVVEEILLNLPAHHVVQVCRLVCHEWKELVDSAAFCRVRCQREGFQPYDASIPPEDWRLFYLLSKFRRNLLKNPRADDGLQGWEIVKNVGDCWLTEMNRKPFPDNAVTKCFVTSNSLCSKKQLIDLKKEGYSDAFMDQQQPPIKISDWYTPFSDYGRQYWMSVELLDQEKNPIYTYHPYKVFFQQGNSYPWCQMTYIFMYYGPGVRFIRFTHGGTGIWVTNSSVEICPAAESLRCTKHNLLKNPSAQDGLQGWNIVRSGGDCCVIGENNSVTRCFETSYELCLKQQLMDLNKEGYSDTFMDQEQPHIKVSDWYAPCFNCGSDYQICVELLDQRKNPIKSFQPEKVIFSIRNSKPWCQMNHVFKNYGPGVRFIRFTHRGRDTRFWAGIYGTRVANSTVLIYPADESFRRRNLNSLKNPIAHEAPQGWEIVANGDDRWVTEEEREENSSTFPVTKCFVTSYGLCLKEQLIDLKEEGYSDALMDQQQPPIKISDWYAPLSDCGSEYQICVELLDEKKNPISTFQPEKVFFQKRTIYPWRQMFHVFRNYGPGVRFIRFTHGGKDKKCQKGQHGIQVTNSSVEIYTD